VTAAGGLSAGASPEAEEPEILLVPLTRPRAPRGAAAPGPSIPEALNTDDGNPIVANAVGIDKDGVDDEAFETAGSTSLTPSENP
jgi:hypothetical protein